LERQNIKMTQMITAVDNIHHRIGCQVAGMRTRLKKIAPASRIKPRIYLTKMVQRPEHKNRSIPQDNLQSLDIYLSSKNTCS
jgi:hypothetical protein